jgi:hypothetical protein
MRAHFFGAIIFIDEFNRDLHFATKAAPEKGPVAVQVIDPVEHPSPN